MSDKIDLAELRELAAGMRIRELDASVVLALVDAVEAARLYARGGQAGPMWAAFVRFEFPTTDGTYSQPALMKERDA